MIAVYLGEPDEEKILNMSNLFFEDVIRELGYRLNYEAVVNYAGNSFFEKSWDVIMENNPFNVAEDVRKSKALAEMAGLITNSKIHVIKKSSPIEEADGDLFDVVQALRTEREGKDEGTDE